MPRAGRSVLLAYLAPLLAGCPDRPLDEARALVAKGEHERAGAAYLRAARTDPANLAAWDGAVDTYCRRLTRVGKCMEILNLELELLGDLQRHKDVLSEVLEARARARIDAGLAKAALDDLERAERAAPERASVHAARAKALIALGRGEAAREAIQRARTLDPRNEEADALIGELPSDEPFGGAHPPPASGRGQGEGSSPPRLE